jgi:hypothetical protein
MPNPNTTQIKLQSNARNSSATNPKKVKAKEGKVDKRTKKTAAIESDSDDDDDDDDKDIEVIGTTKSNTVINPKRKLNETTNQTTGL